MERGNVGSVLDIVFPQSFLLPSTGGGGGLKARVIGSAIIRKY